jgi:hypothetical protein
MKKYISEIYGECPKPNSFVELMAIISVPELYDTSEDDEFIPVRMWRGQGDINWKIHSSAYRRIQLDPYETNKDEDVNLEYYEEHLLKHATHKGFRYQNGRTLSDFELLAKLQHHGAATRLVDFSRNALVGLWFCVTDQINETGLLVGVHSHSIGGMEGCPVTGAYKDIIKGCKKHKHSQVYESPALSSRISAQHAQFLYSGVSSEITGSLQLNATENTNMFIAISPKLKKECVAILEAVFDFRTKTLFPDLDGFGIANGPTVDPTEMDRW